MGDENGTHRAFLAAELGCAALVDAMGRLHRHRAHLLPLTSPEPTRPLLGPAVTLAGVLADGRLRDFAQLRGYGFAVWCGGEATRWGGDTVMPYAANVAVEVDGVCAVPGDYVYADTTGAVVIPAASLDNVLAEASRVDAEDAEFADRIRTEDPAALRAGARPGTREEG